MSYNMLVRVHTILVIVRGRSIKVRCAHASAMRGLGKAGMQAGAVCAQNCMHARARARARTHACTRAPACACTRTHASARALWHAPVSHMCMCARRLEVSSAYIVTAYADRAHVVMACVVMAHIVMASIVVAFKVRRLYSVSSPLQIWRM